MAMVRAPSATTCTHPQHSAQWVQMTQVRSRALPPRAAQFTPPWSCFLVLSSSQEPLSSITYHSPVAIHIDAATERHGLVFSCPMLKVFKSVAARVILAFTAAVLV